MADNGEEKLIAVARHIAKTLGHSDTMTDDILNIFSNFDGRFSREKLSDKLSDGGRGGSSPAALDQALSSLDRRVSHYSAADHSLWSDSADSSAFLDAVDDLLSLVREWSPMAQDKQVADSLDRADDLLQQAVYRLEEEFRTLLEHGGESFDLARNGESTRSGDEEYGYGYSSEEDADDDEGENAVPVARKVTSFDIVIDALPAGTIADLHEIAKRMVVAGYEKECSHVFSSCRREFLEESLSRLGLQKLSIDEVQKLPWTDLEDEIARWTKAATVALRILFPSERRLCERVFFGFQSVSDLSFMEVCRGSTIQLLNFADAVAISSRSPERLFKVLDAYETLRDLIPEFEHLFSNQYCAFLRTEAMTIWKRLGETIRGIFMELENLIRRDPAKQSVPGGGVHPMTRYVMNYLRAACKSRQTLEQVFEDDMVNGGDYRKMDDRASTTSLSVQISWTMELLESNLEAKARVYRDSALSSIFMMNNGRYIVQKVKDSELGELLGDDWIKKHNVKVRQFHVNYQRSSWNKVLGALKLDNSSAASDMATKPIKDRMKLFNSYFDEIWKIQSCWVVFDDQMREELKVAISGNLAPAYRNFLGRFRNAPDVGKNADKYIKYSVEDVEARINNDLFQGIGARK